MNVNETRGSASEAPIVVGDPDSQRTRNRATALAWMRGCEQWNECWVDCYDNALRSVVEDDLSQWERRVATTSTYWKLTHGVKVTTDE